MKIAFIIGWLLFALEALWVGAMFYSKNVGDDAAGRGMATGFAIISLPIVLLAGALLYWGQNSSSRTVQWAVLLFVSIPFLVIAGLRLNNDLTNARHRRNAATAGNFVDPQLTAISAAIDRRDAATLESLLQQTPTINWTARTESGSTLLGYAVAKVLSDYDGDQSVAPVRVLLAHGAPLADNITRSDELLLPAIMAGNTKGTVALLQAVLEAGADANSRTRDGLPLTHITNTLFSLEKHRLLVAHRADPQALGNRPDRLQWTTLMNAAYMQDWDLALFYLGQGVPPEYRAPDGKTAATILEERAAGYVAYRESTPAGYTRLLTALSAPSASPPRPGSPPHPDPKTAGTPPGR